MLCLAVGATVRGADDPPAGLPAFVSDAGRRAVEPQQVPTYLFIDGPLDPESIVKRLLKPDAVVLTGNEYQKLVDAARPKPTAGEPARIGVESIAIAGRVVGELAGLRVAVGVLSDEPGPAWVPVRLDGQVLRSATENGRDLPLRDLGPKGWEVEVSGRGKHDVAIELLVPVKPGAEGSRIDLAIPESASTSVRIQTPGTASDARLGEREPIEARPMSNGQDSLIEAHLGARNRLELSWRVTADPAVQGPPVLSAQGEIALEVDRGTLRARSWWTVRCERGSTRTLRLKLDPADELLSLEIDDQALQVDGLATARGVMIVPLGEPLRSGGSKKLTVVTRRTVPLDVAGRLEYPGVSIDGAASQSGMLAVAHGPDLGVVASGGRGLREADPRVELTPNLRVRPSTLLAYQFVEQPFDLRLRIDPTPPPARVDARTTVTLDAGRAVVDAEFEYHTLRRRPFSLRVVVPQGLEIDAVGPATAVASWQLQDDPAAGTAGSRSRLLDVRLAPAAREKETFAIRLTGRSAFEPAQAVPIGLFAPMDAVTRGGIVAVLPARNLAVDVPTAGARTPFVPLGQEPPAAWTWPAERPSAAAPSALWLRCDGAPRELTLRIVERPRSIHHESRVVVRVDRRRLELAETCAVQVRNGTLRTLDVVVPASLEGRWEIDGDEVASRERLGPAPDGSIHYRLWLAREATDAVRLRFRARLPIEPALAAGASRPVRPEWIRPSEGTASPLKVTIEAESGVRLEPANGWSTADAAGPADGTTVPTGAGLEWVGPEDGPPPAPAVVSAPAFAEMPSVVASRLWLRTTLDPDGSLQTTAWYRIEATGPTVTVRLPDGATWREARVGSDRVEVERLADGATYRIPLAADTESGVAVGLSYRVSAAAAASGWAPPRLLDGAVVQQTLWEIRIPGSRTLPLAPAGWVEENQWYWDEYLFKRRPRLDHPALAAWVAGPGAAAATASAAGPIRAGTHAYLFARVGEPTTLRPLLLTKLEAVLVFSGGALVIGLIVLVGRPPARAAWLAALMAAVAIGAVFETEAVLGGLQSALLGLVLVGVAAVTQRFVERRRPQLLVHEPARSGEAILRGSSRNLAAPADETEGSTIVRPKAATTIEHATAPLAPDAG